MTHFHGLMHDRSIRDMVSDEVEEDLDTIFEEDNIHV